jgi:hypothetical protein
MSRSRSRRIALVATAAAGLLPSIVGAAPALADSPTIEQVHVVRQIPGQCPGFAILAVFEFDRRVTTFVDADGTPIRQTIHAQLEGRTTNLSTGFSIPSFGTRYIETDFRTGEVKSTGTNSHFVLPGIGTIQLGAGLVITDDGQIVQAEGRLDPGGSPALCAALAG